MPELESRATPGADRSSGQRRMDERRRLWDRRARDERRAGADRRRTALQAARERRAGSERRGAEDRRAQSVRRHGRRRRETAEPYTGREIDELRKRFTTPGPVACPSCGGAFTLAAGRRRGDLVARRVACLGCGRAAVVPHSVAARVMIIDHLGERRDALRAVLRGAGHEVVETDDAAVALQAYQAVPADVILLNVLATGRMEATDFLRRLRRDYPDARVVAVAGRASHATSDPLAVAHGMGAVQTLRIPASADQVLRTVDEARR